MTVTHGMDTEAARQAVRQLDAGADELSNLALRVDFALTFEWNGRDADLTRDRWSGVERWQLTTTADQLRSVAALIVEQADQQDQASSASAGWTGSTADWSAPTPTEAPAEKSWWDRFTDHVDGVWRAVVRTGDAVGDLGSKLGDIITGERDWSGTAVAASAINVLGNAAGIVANGVTGTDQHWFEETEGRVGTPLQVPPGGNGVQPPLTPPTSVSSIMQGVSDGYAMNGQGEFTDGAVRITTVSNPGQPTAYIVAIPGTEAWGPGTTGSVHDLTANLHVAMGGQSAAINTVRQAMEAAGIPPGAPVLLAGHSQSGMVAASLASDPGFMSRYHVTNVISAGGPVDIFDVDDRVRVLSLENEHDIVPRLDFGGTRFWHGPSDQPNVTAVSLEANGGWHQVLANHDVHNYVTRAGEAGAAGDRIRAWASDPSMAPFLVTNGGTATAVDIPVHRR